MTRPSISLYLISLVSVLLLGTALMSACTQSGRADTIHASVIAVDGVRGDFVPWDLEHQKGILDADKAAGKTREEAQADIAAYRAKQEKIKEGFTVAYRLLLIASLQNDDPSLTAAIAQGAALVQDVKTLMGSK